MNVSGFINATFSDRTIDVQADSMKVFFKEGEKPVITVRGLTMLELSIVREDVEANKKADGIVAKSNGKGDIIEEAVKAVVEVSLGSSETVPEDYATRFSMLRMGIVHSDDNLKKLGDAMPTEFARRIARNYPTVARSCVEAIIRLIGIGRVPEGKF